MFNIIVAHDQNRGIAKNGGLPWPPNKTDMKYFMNITSNTQDPNKCNAVIMGRKTWDSIDNKYKPLKNRINIILSKASKLDNINETEKTKETYKTTETKDTNEEKEYYIYNSLDAALEVLARLSYVESIFVIGGQEIYELAIKDPRCAKIYVTEFKGDFGPCDRFFPQIPTSFALTSHRHESVLLEFKTYESKYDLRSPEYNYLNLLWQILTYGDEINEERTGVGTLSLPAGFLQFPIDTMNPTAPLEELVYRVPILTTKTMFTRGTFEELSMFLNGKTSVKELQKKNVKIWDGNTSRKYLDAHGLKNYEEGETGPFYGFQWNFFGADYLGANCEEAHAKDPRGVNQLEYCINLLKTDPYSRRIILTAWNPSDIPKMCLPPCHMMYAFKVSKESPASGGRKVLHCTMFQRSGDMFLGIPFNILSTTLLTIYMSRVANMLPGFVSIVISDAHIYKNHIDQVKEQLQRTPYRFPTLKINARINSLADMRKLQYSHMEITDYNKWPELKAQMAV